MNSFPGKRLLALVREGDYAHAGEQEAIELALRCYPRRPDQLVLDVGCGRGGTANYVRQQGWGRVVGVDSEPDSVARARQVYPAVEFHTCDVVDVAAVLAGRFDLIYLFNSFYAFADQPRALTVLRQVARESGRLVIFDYADRGGYDERPLMGDGEPFIPHPVKLSAVPEVLYRAGWELTDAEDCSAAYGRWYESLVRRMDGKREQLTAAVGAEVFDSVRGQYTDLVAAIRDGRLGGVIIHATAARPG
jgi:SAM-dependent methyltransferase